MSYAEVSAYSELLLSRPCVEVIGRLLGNCWNLLTYEKQKVQLKKQATARARRGLQEALNGTIAAMFDVLMILVILQQVASKIS